MRLSKGAEVFTASGEKIGNISRVVIDAKTRDVTDVVVARGGFLDRDEKVIPVGLVNLDGDNQIRLRETNQGVDDFMDYETTHYVPVERSGAPYENIEATYWYPPVNVQMQMPRAGLISEAIPDVVPETETSIPEGRVAIAEGAEVVSADDKHIGDVEQVITSPQGNHVTHFVISKGFLLKEHKVVPMSWVTGVTDDKVRLSVESPLFENLPDYDPSK